MAAFDTTRTHASASTAGVLQSYIGAFFARVADWHDARTTRAALSRLGDRELEDIGLVRADIDKVARDSLR